MLRKVVLGTLGVGALIPAVGAATPIKEEPASPAKPLPMKASELPIYEAPHADYAEKLHAENNKPTTSYLSSVLMTPVHFVREQVQIGVEHTEHTKNIIQDHYHEFQDRSDWIVKYLREEENKQMRYGAVAMGGLTGFIFGLRGGFIRRIIYAGAGTTAMGLVCFPEDTKEILHNNSVLAKQYINIAYNFLYGVKPGDPQLEVKFPELSFPKDLSEFKDLTLSVASTIKQAVMPPPAKDDKPEKKD